MPEKHADDWSEWKNVIKIHMEATDNSLRDIGQAISSLNTAIAKLQVQSGVWGFLAGAVPTMGLILFLFIKEKVF